MAIRIDALERPGLIVENFKLYTNDPRSSTVSFRISALVNPLPDYVKGIGNANLTTGDKVGSFQVWPTAKPQLSVARQTTSKISLRIRPNVEDNTEVKLLSQNTAAVKYNLRREGKSNVYWLDIEVAPIAEAGVKTWPIELQSMGGRAETLTVALTLRVLDDGIITTPAKVDCGTLTLGDLQKFPTRVARLGLRKIAGSFQVKAVSSTLEFLNPVAQTLVEGSNYVILINTVAEKLPKAGTYEGKLIVETDDLQKPRLEIPVKIVLSDQ
ncbi:MAG: hypothetical protein HY231_06440 [Acidobacteria bacterium]|nr:hypothetical protein [Acidobacteriota bacterium]